MADKAYKLCSACIQRQDDDERFLRTRPPYCYICHGLSAKVAKMGSLAIRQLRSYQFDSFSVGVIIPDEAQEREDQLRSHLQIRGLETIKFQLSGKVAELLKKKTRKRIDRRRPQLTLLVDFSREIATATSKSLFVFGRYTKPRGVSQRKEFCEKCSGRGCPECKGGYIDAPSMEEVLGRCFGRILGSSRTKFTWIGSEDRESLVYPPGRSFIMEAKDPKLRRVPPRLSLATGKGRASISNARVLRGRPATTPSFIFQTKAFLGPVEKLDGLDLSLARKLAKSVILYRNNKGKSVEKRVYSVRVEKRGRGLVADIWLDGGLPVKRLVSGESVSPSLSEVLGVPLVCERFDIVRVKESKQLGG